MERALLTRTCRGCGRTLENAEFAAATRTSCKGCELFAITQKNMKGRGAPLLMTRREVLHAFGSSDECRCFYCGIGEAAYVSLKVPTPAGFGLRLGLDRVDTSAPYTAENIVVCCLVCNRLKSSTFTHDEMLRIGTTVAAIWRARGLDVVNPTER